MTAQDSDFDHVSVDLPETDAERDERVKAENAADRAALWDDTDDDEPDAEYDDESEPPPGAVTVTEAAPIDPDAPVHVPSAFVAFVTGTDRLLTLNDVPTALRGKVKVLLRQAKRKYGGSYTQRLLKRFAKASK